MFHQVVEPVSDAGTEWHEEGGGNYGQEHEVVVVPDEEGAGGEDDAGEYGDGLFCEVDALQECVADGGE